MPRQASVVVSTVLVDCAVTDVSRRTGESTSFPTHLAMEDAVVSSSDGLLLKV